MERNPGYDLDALKRQIPEDRSELFLGFGPWREDCQNWARSDRALVAEETDKELLRTIWDNPENPQERVLIDVVETASAEAAIAALGERLSWNQLAELPEGPADIGYGSFVHPEGVPPGVFFILGNLCISVVSYARGPVDVLPWAKRLADRLRERPDVSSMSIALEVDRAKAKIGERMNLDYRLPWSRGEDGFTKLFAEGASLSGSDKRIAAVGTRRGKITVEIFSLEPGRETYGGKLNLDVE